MIPPFQSFSLNLQGVIKVYEKPIVMGILNVTPDSFYPKSRYGQENILNKTKDMCKEGVDIVDIGGYSTRPFCKDISIEEELERVIPAITLIGEAYPQLPISIDTFRSVVAQKALEAGAHIVNDISGGQYDKNIFNIVAQAQCPYILMHTRGTPQDMMQHTKYKNITLHLLSYFSKKIYTLREKGVKDIIIDLGFGFAKNRVQNEYLLRHISLFQCFSCPILVGLSRKSMIYKKLSLPIEEALWGTIAYNTMALLQGVSILRVHDVKPAKDTINLLFDDK